MFLLWPWLPAAPFHRPEYPNLKWVYSKHKNKHKGKLCAEEVVAEETRLMASINQTTKFAPLKSVLSYSFL
jgi:hypothetical protein